MTPQDWKRELLGNCVRIRSGVAPADLHLLTEGQYPYLKVEDLNASAKYQKESRTHTNDRHRSLVPAGTVIFPKRGAAIMNNKVRINLVDCYLDSNLMSLEPIGDLRCEYLFYLLQNEQLFKIADTSSIPQINNKHIEPYKVLLPPRQEQQRIAEVLLSWDVAIEKTEQLIAAKEKSLKGLMQRLILKSGFSGHRLSEFVNRVTRKNTTGNDHPLTISGRDGLISQSHFFDKRIAAETTEHYTLLKRGEFGYNRSYSAGYPYGAIKRLDTYDEGILSSLYLCFSLKSDVPILSGYLTYFCEAGGFNHHINKVAQEGARNHGLLNIAADDFFAMNLPLPPIEKQARVVEIIGNAGREIELLRKSHNKLQQQKRGLMQKLLTGQWQVVKPVSKEL